jgi:hypothetical protein
MRAALIDSSSKVENLILLDENSDYNPPEGLRLVIPDVNDVVRIGDIWTGGVWVPIEVHTPAPEEPVETPLSLEDQVAQLRAVVEQLLLAQLEG